jgi:hypothetical protein
LSVYDAIKDVRGIDHFKAFIDKLYSQSPKHSRALKIACHDLRLQFVKVGRVLGMRWVSSSFKRVKAVWTSLGALHSHLTNSLEDTAIDANLKSTFISLLKRLGSPEFLLNPGVMYDTLQELFMQCNELQTQLTTLSRAERLIKNTVDGEF